MKNSVIIPILKLRMSLQEQGFTLVEVLVAILISTIFVTEWLVVVVIIGILTAIVAPSYLAMINRYRLNNALTTLQAALQEAQREAIRKNKTCTVYIPDGNQIVSDCFITADNTSTGLIPSSLNGVPARKLGNVALVSNLPANPKRIKFSFRGNTNSSGTIVLYLPDKSIPDKKCLVISLGLGIMRTRNYSGSIDSLVSSSYCRIPL